MDRLDAMRTFLAVADRRSFAAAARDLRLSPAAATRAVAALEASVGAALLARTTRAVRLTDRGAFYAERCRALLAEHDALTAAMRGEDAAPRGLLSVTAPVVFGRLHVLPVVERLAARHPQMEVRLTLLDRVTHLVEEGFDLAVRIGAPADSALVGLRLAETRRVVVASPGYLAAHGAPETPADLRRHRVVAFEGIGATDEWRFGADGRVAVRVAPWLRVNLAEAALDAAARGAGLTRVLSYQAETRRARGELVEALERFAPPPVPVTLLYPAARRASANVRAFVRAARAQFGLGGAEA
jgi:DNA-binding transcriptional LysR family regulator